MADTIGLPRIHYRGDDACVASLDGFSLCRVFGKPTIEAVDATMIAHSFARRARPTGVASITLIDPSAALPGEDVRGRAKDAVSEAEPNLAIDALVILGDGFWASALRSAAMTLGVLSSSTRPRKTFRHENEAFEWVVTTLGVAPRYQTALRKTFEQMESGQSIAS